MNTLVTGGAGFIGSRLVEVLLEHEYKVTVFDNLSAHGLTFIRHLLDDIDLIVADLRNDTEVVNAVDGKDIVYHLGARACHRKSFVRPNTYFTINIIGTFNVLNAMKETGTDHIVFASSNSVYGRQDFSPIEETASLRPRGAYAISKRACEDLIRFFKEDYEIKGAINRFNNVFGDWRTRPDTIFPELAQRVVDGDTVDDVLDTYYRTRDFTWIDDIVQGIILSGNYIIKNDVGVEPITFNLATGKETPIALVSKLIGKHMNSPPPRIEPPFAHETINICSDITRAKKVLGYQPKTSFREGIKKFVDSWSEHYLDE